MSRLPSSNGIALHPDLTHLVFSADMIAGEVRRLGAAISADYAELNPLLIGVLKGVVPFMADLMRTIDIRCTLDFLAITSFPGSQGGGSVQILKDLELSATGRHIVFVEDIIDTGLTLHYLIRWLEQRRPASVSVCTLLDRPRRRLINLPIRYQGFEAPDDFIVGYGLDHKEQYRNLPYIGVLRPEVYLGG